MNIYIPSHLRKIELVDQFCKLIEEYSKLPTQDTNDSFNDYQYYLKSDPVKKFLIICIPEEKVAESQDYESTINYVSKLFYSVKGTVKVFEYMKKYLNLNFEGDIIYTTDYIEFKLVNNKLVDESIFYDSLDGFLNALVYYKELRVITENSELVLKDNIYNYIGSELINYNNITAEPYEIRD